LLTLNLSLQYRCSKSKQTIKALFVPTTGTHNLQGLQVHCQLSGQHCRIVLQATQKISLYKCQLELAFAFMPTDGLLCNGFQSWTNTKVFSTTDTQLAIHPLLTYIAAPMGDYALYDYPEKQGILHGWTYGIAQRSPQQQFLFGSINEQSGYTLVQFKVPNNTVLFKKDLKGKHLKPHKSFVALDVVMIQGTEPHIWQSYTQQFKANLPANTHSNPTQIAPQISGFTTWYNYYTAISQKIITHNLQNFVQQNIPIDVFQIDDGWQTFVGDWTQFNHKFPAGMHYLAQQIKQAGLKAGLWLAPFVCQKQSTIYRYHPNWLLHNAKGEAITAGYNIMWQSSIYVLDFYNPKVRAYLKTVLHTLLNVWGFDLLKVDFLYAVALQPPPNKTRGEVMFEAMQWLRKHTPNKLLLGCGVPLGSAIGQVDYCRIGADVHLDWEMGALQKLKSRERVSTVNALQNTIFRQPLNGLVWGNDPDVAILRKEKNFLNPEQRFTLFFINQLFGSVQFISDNIALYDAQTMQLYKSQFPLLPKQIHHTKQIKNRAVYDIAFSINNLQYQAFSNHTAYVQPVELKNSDLFFNTQTQTFELSGTWIQLQPYQTICFLLVDVSKPISVVGSINGHLFAGAEVQNLTIHNQQRISVAFYPNLPYKPRVLIALKTNATQVLLNEKWVTPSNIGFGKDLKLLVLD
jgi:alpha-galactosidase